MGFPTGRLKPGSYANSTGRMDRIPGLIEESGGIVVRFGYCSLQFLEISEILRATRGSFGFYQVGFPQVGFPQVWDHDTVLL